VATFAELVERTRFEAPLTLPAVTSGTLPTLTGQALRLSAWVADAWRDIQMEDRDWRWMRRQTIADVNNAGGVDYTPAQMGIATGGFSRWWREGAQSEGAGRYMVRSYLAAQPGNEWEVRWVPYDQFAARFMVGAQQAGPPQFWSEAPSGDFLVGPIPDQAYKVRADYMKGVQELVAADNTVPEFPAKFHWMIMWRALYQNGSFDAAPDTLERARDNYDRLESVLLREQGARIEIQWGMLSR
jgi:hypothetical protein